MLKPLVIDNGLIRQMTDVEWNRSSRGFRLVSEPTTEQLLLQNSHFVDVPAYSFIEILSLRIVRSGIYLYDINFQHNVRLLGFYECNIRVNGVSSYQRCKKNFWSSAVPDTVNADGSLALDKGDVVSVELWTNIETAVRSGSWMSLKLIGG